MAYQHVKLERADGVATLTLHRPDAYNALDLALGRELFQASIELDEDPEVRCVVITGSGKAFCAGGDVKSFVDNLGRIGAHIKELTTYLHGAISRLCRSDKPVIMAVHGVAPGGGFPFPPPRAGGGAPGAGRVPPADPQTPAPPPAPPPSFPPRPIGLRCPAGAL